MSFNNHDSDDPNGKKYGKQHDFQKDIVAETPLVIDEFKKSFSQNDMCKEDILDGEAIVIWIKSREKNLSEFIKWYRNYKN